jgi:hypothetical protein
MLSHQVVSIRVQDLVTANSGTYTLHKLMQQVVLRQRHQVLLLMHNLLPAAQRQEQLRANMCNSNR